MLPVTAPPGDSHMNKYLMMTSAALLATTAAGNAEAATHTYIIHFGSGSTYCDSLLLHKNGNVYAGKHLYTACGSGPDVLIEGLGSSGGVPPGKGKGGNVNIGDDTLAYIYHQNYSVSYDLQTPFKNGGTYAVWINDTGSSSYIANEGVYEVGNKARSNSHESTLSKVVALIAKRR
jgi:hypothetical protein